MEFTEFVLLFAGIICLTLGFTGFCISIDPLNLIMETPEFDITDYNQCSNLTLIGTAECLQRFVSTFYNYTVRIDTYKSLDNIKENGGDCFDYSNLYVEMAKSLGFKAETHKLPTHMFAVIYDETGYVVIDMLSPNKYFKYGKVKDEE